MIPGMAKFIVGKHTTVRIAAQTATKLREIQLDHAQARHPQSMTLEQIVAALIEREHRRRKIGIEK